MRVHDSFVGDDLACRVTCGYESCCLSDGCSQLRWLPAVRLLREMPLRSCRRVLASGWLAVGPERVADFGDEALRRLQGQEMAALVHGGNPGQVRVGAVQPGMGRDGQVRLVCDEYRGRRGDQVSGAQRRSRTWR